MPRIVVESAERADARAGVGCGCFLLGLLIGLPGLCGVWLAARINSDFIAGILEAMDHRIPWWVALLLLVGGGFMMVANLAGLNVRETRINR